MTITEFYLHIKNSFPFNVTLKQDVFLKKISQFILSENQDEVFVLKGYAGTGKTTLLSNLVNQLPLINKKYVMLAPTGRAAKVISNYAKQPAFTIHKKIYYPKKDKNSGMAFTMQANKHKNTIFIVDESSMISDNVTDATMYTHGSLLDDLMYYVYSGQNCKLIIVGDTAQLPPVGMDESPALNESKLALNYHMKVDFIELTEVMRQEEDSGILYNATELREQLQQEFYDFFEFDVKPFKDIVRLQDGYETLDAIHDAYSKKGSEETIFIVRSNKRANQYNQQIRTRILDNESEISAGDYIMVVKNNYFWLKDSKTTDFIANGDILEILQIYKHHELYGFRFASVKVRMIDYPDMLPFDTIVLLDTLHSESASLTYEQSNKLYQEVLLDYQDEITAFRRMQKVKNNEYFNALQIKFAYAVTCHKSQGGQWDTVFIEQPYLPDGISKDYMRWLYTALTRAKEKVYLIGFNDDFFNE
ncbi:UvrD-like helicase C-terminal domain-containing protein [Paenimyroides ummariense]|uniref:UvrD-like helicase C-terminal domain-containing protein n=1 Tax=Paenimyroides ummariense TaxID=913024 RepID=A0A1I5AIY7_9FLAO|nr:AAA family ATPase [Paenimyroides ummariense]SFN62407.1 UvrD-like helicase C-terminal domain-containing protein [Paenimyroides ummariense]